MLNYPLLTAITLTYNRPQWLQQAVRYFLRQDYVNKQLLILDDSPQPTPIDAPNVRYVHLPEKVRTMGEKRNLAISLAQGEIICHMKG